MTTPQTARCLIAAAAITARVEGMKAENMQRYARSEDMAYTEDHFAYWVGQLELLAMEVINQ